VLAVAFTYGATWIFETGRFANATKFVVEHAYAGLHAPSPFEELALVYPPIPLIVYALLGYVGATVLLSVVTTLSLLWIAIRYSKDLVTAAFSSAAILMPVVVINELADATAAIFAAMLAWAMYMLARYTEQEYSVYLFQAGLLISVGIFIDLRMAAFAFAVSLALFIDFAIGQFWRGVSVALVLIFPTVFFFVAWNFVQWVFTGTFSILFPPLGYRPIWESWPAAVAYYFALLCVAISPRSARRRYLVSVCLAPTVVVLLSSASGLTMAASEFALIGLAYAVVTTTQVGNIWLRRLSALVTLLAAVALYFTLPPLHPLALNLATGAQTIPPPVVTHHWWEIYVFGARIATAVVLAILTILLAIHSLAKLTGETS
jgi:hypothetical protein